MSTSQDDGPSVQMMRVRLCRAASDLSGKGVSARRPHCCGGCAGVCGACAGGAHLLVAGDVLRRRHLDHRAVDGRGHGLESCLLVRVVRGRPGDCYPSAASGLAPDTSLTFRRLLNWLSVGNDSSHDEDDDSMPGLAESSSTTGSGLGSELEPMGFAGHNYVDEYADDAIILTLFGPEGRRPIEVARRGRRLRGVGPASPA